MVGNTGTTVSELRMSKHAKNHRSGKLRAAHRRRLVKRRGEKFSNEEIWERDNYICQLCGLPMAMCELRGVYPLAPTIDHITPISLGGPHTRANVQSAHAYCNSMKSSYSTSYALVSSLFRWFPIDIPADIASTVLQAITCQPVMNTLAVSVS